MWGWKVSNLKVSQKKKKKNLSSTLDSLSACFFFKKKILDQDVWLSYLELDVVIRLSKNKKHKKHRQHDNFPSDISMSGQAYLIPGLSTLNNLVKGYIGFMAGKLGMFLLGRGWLGAWESIALLSFSLVSTLIVLQPISVTYCSLIWVLDTLVKSTWRIEISSLLHLSKSNLYGTHEGNSLAFKVWSTPFGS